MLTVDVKHFITKADGSRAYMWKTIPVSDALKLADPHLRCPECKGKVGLIRASTDGVTVNRAEHRKRNKGCSMGDCFDGEKRLAENPIEVEQESLSE